MQVGCGVIIHTRGDGRGHYGEPAHLPQFWRAVGVRRSQRTRAGYLAPKTKHGWLARRRRGSLRPGGRRDAATDVRSRAERPMPDAAAAAHKHRDTHRFYHPRRSSSRPSRARR